jgi:hypothetical protein
MIVAEHRVLFAGHGWHLVEILAVFFTSIIGIWVGEAIRRRPRNESADVRREALLWLVAVFSAAAGGIHLIVMPEHFEESALYGTFFLVSALVQIAYSGWLLARPSRVLLAIGAVGNTAVVLLWLFTRTIEIPLGPAAGTTEEFGSLDVLCAIFEVLMAAGALVFLLRGRSRRAARQRSELPRPGWQAPTLRSR